MESIRTVIVEDEEASLYMLKEELHPHQNINVIGEFRNGKEGLEGINELKPDLVFVDIEMPEMDGFQMLQRLECNPAVIFCTGHKKYALDAWDYHAADFIVKPIEQSRVKKALEKALDDIRNNKQNERLNKQRLFAGFIELQWSDHVGKKTRFFSPDEITHIQGDRDYLKIHLAPAIASELGLYEPTITIKKTIKEAIKDLSEHAFYQIHKSYLINLQKVLEWNKTKKEISLFQVENPLPIGRAFIKKFQQKWEEMHG